MRQSSSSSGTLGALESRTTFGSLKTDTRISRQLRKCKFGHHTHRDRNVCLHASLLPFAATSLSNIMPWILLQPPHEYATQEYGRAQMPTEVGRSQRTRYRPSLSALSEGISNDCYHVVVMDHIDLVFHESKAEGLAGFMLTCAGLLLQQDNRKTLPPQELKGNFMVDD